MDYVDFGGSGANAILVHANGYHPGCYSQLATALTDDFRIYGPLLRPLWKDQRPTDFKHWHILADDLLKFIEENNLGPVVAIGHSMGAIASWMAQATQPSLFRHVVLIEPVVIPWPIIKITKRLPYSVLAHILPFLKVALNRTDSWSSKSEIKKYLISKKVFRRFDPEVLDDFIQFGFKPSDQGYTLSYSKYWEARIYGTAPDAWKIMNSESSHLSVLKAEYSDVITKSTWNSMRKIMTKADLEEVKGVGHLMPFENPQLTAHHILKHLRS